MWTTGDAKETGLTTTIKHSTIKPYMTCHGSLARMLGQSLLTDGNK